jgi:imidazoleglycerol-phosphate dehydratase
VAENARMNLHLDLLRGTNSHHCVEALFKAFARALSMAVSPSRRVAGIPSTKGTLA